MKVVQINCSSFGSTGNIAKDIHKRLVENGDESHIFYGVGSNGENISRIGSQLDVKIHAVLSRNFGKQGYFSKLATKGLIRKIEKINPDVIHLHNLHGSYLNLPLLFKFLKKSEAKKVITLHDCWLFTGKCPHFTEVQCYKWKESCGDCPQLSIYPKSKKDTTKKCLQDKKEWLSGIDNLKIVAVSNWLRDTAKQSFLNQYSIETIYSGIDESVFKEKKDDYIRNKYNLNGKFIILGVSSEWKNQKGLDDFLKLSKLIDEDEIIVLVGLTEEQIKEMPKNIIGIKRTESKEELSQLYSCANVFVNTSREETFGLVTAEAMACGTPVIVYDSTACSEIVTDESGYVASSKNVEEVYGYINKEKALPKKSKFKMVYSSSQMTKRYIELYKERSWKEVKD